MKLRAGKHKAKPRVIAGITNIMLYRRTMKISPLFERPIILVTPISKLLVSTLIIKRE